MSNFLVIEFGDNDFSSAFRTGMHELIDYWSDDPRRFCPFAIKEYMIIHVVSYTAKWAALRGGDIQVDRKYFESMRVTFRDKMPTYEPWEGSQEIDHDGGSIAMNLHTKDIWTF